MSAAAPALPAARTARDRIRGFGLVRVHAVVVAVAATTLVARSPSLTLTLGGLVTFFGYVGMGWAEARRSQLWFTPLSFYLLFSSIGLGLSAVHLGGIVPDRQWIPFANRLVERDDVARAYVLFLLGSLSLHAGVQWFRPTRHDADDARAADLGAGRASALVVLWMVGLVTSLSPQVSGLFGGVGGFLKMGAFAAVSAFAITPRRHFRLSFPVWAGMLAVGVGGLFAANLMSYSKAFVMYSFLPLLWLFLLRRNLRPWIPGLAAVLVLFYFTLVAPVVALARATPLQPGQNPALHLLRTAEMAVSGASYTGQGLTSAQRPTFQYQLDRFLNRTFDPMPLAFVMGETRSYGFLDGESFNRLAYALIPRVIWRDKPVVSQGAWFAVYLGFAESESTATSVWGITAPGELYWNFGIPGLVVGMLLIGALLGSLWNLAGADPRHKPVRMLLYTIVMLNMVNMETAVTVLVFVMLLTIVFRAVLFGLRLVPRHGPQGNASLAAR